MEETFLERLMTLLGGIFVFTVTIAIMVGIPLLFLYIIYRMIKGLMTHNANLKSQNQRDNDRWNAEGRD